MAHDKEKYPYKYTLPLPDINKSVRQEWNKLWKYRKEMVIWCEKNITHGWTTDIQDISNGIDFWFESEQDCLIFTLRWAK